MRQDSARWNKRYLAGDGVVKAKPEPELEQVAEQLPGSGLALEIAAGKGANALYLASLGLNVIAADAAIQGLRICHQQAQREQLSVMPLVIDMEQWHIPQNTFDLVAVVRFLDRRLFASIAAALKPGGMLFYKTFNFRHLEVSPKFNSGFVLKSAELLQAFSMLEVIKSSEAGNSSYLLARKSAIAINTI